MARDIFDAKESANEFGEGIYVNLAVEVKKYIDSGKTRDARDVLLKFYDLLPTHPDFDDVDKADFYELAERVRNARGTRTRDMSVLTNRFQSLGVPPPKAAPLESPGRRTSRDPSVKMTIAIRIRMSTMTMSTAADIPSMARMMEP